MIIHCTKCGINWASLWTDCTNEEHAVEVCPVCKTDMYLDAGTDIIGYIKCPFTGKITNTTTGTTWEEDNAVFKKATMRVVVGKPTYQEVAEERESREEAAIDAYIASGGDKSIYHQTIKKVK